MRTVRGIVRLGEAQSIPMRRRGECPTLDKIQNTESSVQLKVQLAGDHFGSWRIFFLGVRAALPSYHELRPTGEDSFGLLVYLF